MSLDDSDVRSALTMDAIQFIHVFAPIIAKAAMQTYLEVILASLPSESSASRWNIQFLHACCNATGIYQPRRLSLSGISSFSAMMSSSLHIFRLSPLSIESKQISTIGVGSSLSI